MSRPSCGDRPVLWKEIHTAKSSGVADLLGILAVVAIFGWIGYLTYRVGAPALLEWWQYGSSRTAPNASRMEFNYYLRGITSVIELVCLLIVAGAAAEGVAAERARSTWESLLATTLRGHEILTAKMLGAVWKTRWGIVLLLALWSAGMLTGCASPTRSVGGAGIVAFLIVVCRGARNPRLPDLARHCARDVADDRSAHPVDRHIRALLLAEPNDVGRHGGWFDTVCQLPWPHRLRRLCRGAWAGELQLP